MHTYTLIRTHRRTLALQIRQGEIIVRAPFLFPRFFIDRFVRSKHAWIEKHLHTTRPSIGEEDIGEMRAQLTPYIQERVRELAEGKHLPPIQYIRVTRAKTRWGSCSRENHLCFSYRLAYFLDTPEKRRVIDAVIYHELAHTLEKNHQKPFWNLVIGWMPEYREVVKMLANYGSIV